MFSLPLKIFWSVHFNVKAHLQEKLKRTYSTTATDGYDCASKKLRYMLFRWNTSTQWRS